MTDLYSMEITPPPPYFQMENPEKRKLRTSTVVNASYKGNAQMHLYTGTFQREGAEMHHIESSYKKYIQRPTPTDRTHRQECEDMGGRKRAEAQ